MAAVPLMTQTAVLSQLASNVAPEAPSIWPPAIGYWLIGLLLATVIVSAVIKRYKRRHLRHALRRLNALQSRSADPAVLVDLHVLLRELAIRYHAMPPSTPPAGFKAFIEECASSAAPEWLNAHYDPNTRQRVNWTEARKLVSVLCRRRGL